MNTEKIFDRRRGTFYGLAIGDALGAAVEFQYPGEFEPVTGYRDGGPHNLKAGEWTDDTSMALALADSLASGQGLRGELERYSEWYRHGKYSVNGRCFDIGNATQSSLMSFECNSTFINNYGEGNGSLMRLAPVPIMLWNDGILSIFKFAIDSSITTHANLDCCLGCCYLAYAIKKLITGSTKEHIVSGEFFEPCCIEVFQDDFEREFNHVPQEIIKEKVNSYIDPNTKPVASGHAPKTLHAALWAFRESNSFEETVLKAVNLGDDADTVGAIAGQLAGAYYGYSGIPNHLIEGLARKDMIERYLEPILG
jgi:ADP-ribosyl-[dinitrogen reductase] hydrolase